MADVLMTAGDDFEHPMLITEDDQPRGLNINSSVSAALVDENDVVLIGSTGQSPNTAGADWPGGRIVVVFAKELTGLIDAPKIGKIQVREVTPSGQTTSWFSEFFSIQKSAI